ncbi:MAG TPA: hypothetical protein VGM90_39915 [Kofleriaceae bacterium]|jgi:hypothetical protein
MRGILGLSAALLVGCAQAGPGSGPPNDRVDAAGGGDDGTGSDLGSGLGSDLPDAAIDAPPVMIDAAPAQVLSKTFAVKMVGAHYWRGWISKQGTTAGRSSVDNTFTGEISPGYDLDSYLVFPLTGITASQVIDATLRLQVQGFEGNNTSTETISVWDVTTPADVLDTTPGTVAIHDDLETGVKYGMFPTKATDVGTVLTIPLDAAAATDIKAKIGQDFAIGMSMDTVPGYVLFSSNSEAETLELVIHYNP